MPTPGEIPSEQPFGYRERADGSVAISHRGRVVTTLRHDAAARFKARAADADPRTVQQLMARATGNFKRGNERSAGRRR